MPNGEIAVNGNGNKWNDVPGYVKTIAYLTQTVGLPAVFAGCLLWGVVFEFLPTILNMLDQRIAVMAADVHEMREDAQDDSAHIRQFTSVVRAEHAEAQSVLDGVDTKIDVLLKKSGTN